MPTKEPDVVYYHQYPTDTLALMGRGEIGIIMPNESLKLSQKKLMTIELKRKVDAANGVVTAKEVQGMVKAAGVGADNFTTFVPFAVRHLTSKKQMKVLKLELADRVAKEKALKKKLDAEQAEQDKAAKAASAAAAKLEQQRLKEEAKLAKAELKAEQFELKRLQRRVTMDQKAAEKAAKIAALPKNVEAAAKKTRRNTMEAMLKGGASKTIDMDKAATLEKWAKQPKHTQYKASHQLKTEKEGFLSFEVGDLITCIEQVNGGYCTGILVWNGTEGIFPDGYASPAT